MGVVYRATHLRLNRTVALKLLAEELASDETFHHRFERESRLAAALDHPHVIPIYDAGLADGLLYLSMRFVDGADLAGLINQEGRLAPQRACAILRQVADALDAAHAVGLIHRDVKPANILIAPGSSPGQPEHVYLSDFGLSRQLDSSSATSDSIAGTFHYMAPERFEGAAPQAAIDQYALGCVAYKCLTGAPPFTRAGFAATMAAHLNAPPPCIGQNGDGLPPGVDAVLAKAIAKQPADRYATCLEFVTALQAAIGASPTAVEPDLPTAPLTPRPAADPPLAPARRAGTRLALAATVAVMLVVASVATFLIRSRTPGAAGAAGAPGVEARPAASVRLEGELTGVAVGPDGSVYFAAGGENQVRRIEPSGSITTVAGTGAEGFSGDNGPATQAQLDDPQGVAIDPASALYLTDEDNNRVRRVDPDGTITTIAGTSTQGGFSGDGGPATLAQLDSPEGVAIDDAGNLYVADTDNHRIRRIDPDGTITTIAGTGTGTQGFSGDGGPATQAELADPKGVVIGPDGAVYVADTGNHRIRKIDDGIITTIAGTGAGTQRFSGDGGPAVQAALDRPESIAIAGDGAIYVADTGNDRIRGIDPDGTITTIAGTGIRGFSGDRGPADQAQLAYPTGVAIDHSGTLYITDEKNRRVRRIDGGVITTVAGTGPGYPGDGGPAIRAQLDFPTGVAIGPDGAVYVADTGNDRVRRVDADGIITTVAGTGTEGSSGDGGPATQARLAYPTGVALDQTGNLYIADGRNDRLRRVDTDGIITTVAGTGTGGSSGDGGPATQAQLAFPTDVAIDQTGNLYITEAGYHRLRRVDTDGIITTVAGTGTEGFSGDGGPATQARLTHPEGIAVASDGTLYITDDTNRIRRVDPDGIITTLAGTGAEGFSGDGGPATQARLASPEGVAIGPDGTLYIADSDNDRIRGIDPDGTITTIAGTGAEGSSGDGGPATQAQLAYPTGVAVASDGTLYITEGDDRIRRIDPAGVSTTIAGDG